VILGLINFLGTRYTARIDLTENQVFTLAPQSQQVLRNLNQPVKVWVFDQQSNPRIRALLEQYQRQGHPRFSFEFVNPQAQPGLAQKYGVRGFGEAYLESGQRVQRLEQGLSEPSLTPAIEQITSNAAQAKIYFLQGHGERSLQPGQGSISEALKALGGRNFAHEPLNLVRQQIPQDAAAIVIAGPKQSFFPAEVQRLQDYLRQGGSLLLMVDPETNPGLENLLKDWGVRLDNRLAVDASGSGQAVGLGPAVPLVNQYGQHPITQDFGQDSYSFYPLAQSLETSQTPGQQTTELLRTGDQSWAEGDPEGENLQFDPVRDRQGPLTLGAALSRPANQGNKRESRLVVIGDSDFATDGLFNQQLNGDVFLNSVTWLSNRPNQTLSIRPKEPTNRRINLTPETSRLIALIALGALPLAAFSTAGVFWWRRR
jgi:ABC-type uncharacterized transport system involved in gliding motility auxiliary subunit